MPAPSSDRAPDAPAPRYAPPRVRRAVIALAAALTVAGVGGGALLPYLTIEHPLWLLATSADGRNIVLATPRLDAVTLALVAVPRRALGMLATFGLGWLYGDATRAWSARRLPRLSRLIELLERMFARYPRAALVLWPTYTTSALAGARGAPWRQFVPWMLVGQLVYVWACVEIGAALAGWTTRVVAWVSPHLLEATLASLGAAALYQLVAWRKRRTRAAG
ncbi:MAG: hypothetical protein IT374_11010 [Polyangiaceae bacterium]|nr:hypothetical protein [Polyangiaceae bacterium]